MVLYYNKMFLQIYTWSWMPQTFIKEESKRKFSSQNVFCCLTYVSGKKMSKSNLKFTYNFETFEDEFQYWNDSPFQRNQNLTSHLPVFGQRLVHRMEYVNLAPIVLKLFNRYVTENTSRTCSEKGILKPIAHQER